MRGLFFNRSESLSFPPSARHLSEEKQAEWIAQMKNWEKENPIDKPAKNAAAFGTGSAVICTAAIAIQLGVPSQGFSLWPLCGLIFGYGLYLIARRRYVRWDAQRADYAQTLIAAYSQDPQ